MRILKAIRYESTSLNRTVADKSYRVIVALNRVEVRDDSLLIHEFTYSLFIGLCSVTSGRIKKRAASSKNFPGELVCTGILAFRLQ